MRITVVHVIDYLRFVSDQLPVTLCGSYPVKVDLGAVYLEDSRSIGSRQGTLVDDNVIEIAVFSGAPEVVEIEPDLEVCSQVFIGNGIAKVGWRVIIAKGFDITAPGITTISGEGKVEPVIIFQLPTFILFPGNSQFFTGVFTEVKTGLQG
ncbi:MAG: hypothetical protein JSV77_01615 [Dehalococcoidales bacterium]|nr:MAG: hypothetical protein JSV77_01615 [Dehalococcoidales bacterium]